jgi:dephospho-CoA kinase
MMAKKNIQARLDREKKIRFKILVETNATSIQDVLEKFINFYNDHEGRIEYCSKSGLIKSKKQI